MSDATTAGSGPEADVEARAGQGAPASAGAAAGVPPQLAAYRATIDNLDAALIHLLAERFRCTRQVGRLKADLHLPPSDPAREEQQVARLRSLAEEAGLDPVFAEKFFAFIVAEVIRHHEAIRDGLPEDAP
ncbi:chorismate mutase [Actinomyces sp. MRS3W]|uniref:chorismate mutase n=1 Tax=Actinomyces sp. MRS3W TaxID=2800796 RepID=UPI0028FD9164|nr:chorismate mutase [Actinomyces sp. MRS3W]MDU0347476.1 chorismate mutase [Actinomyces sp. MRS3W]